MAEDISQEIGFPTVITPRTNNLQTALNACLERKVSLREKLLKSGALLFRGFPVRSPIQFAQFVRQFSDRPLQKYVGGASPRHSLASGVYTSTEYAAEITLPLHNEMSYTYRWPSLLFVACVIAPKENGETPIADSRALPREMGRDIGDEFSKKRIQYLRRFPSFTNDGYSWQEAFETDSREVVEEFFEQGKIGFEWRTDGELLLTEIRPATTTHPVTGEEVWFN